MRSTCSLSAAPCPATACFTWLGEYWTTSQPAARGLGHGQPAGLADRHRGAHVDLEEHPLDGDHVGPELGDQGPQLALELGQALGSGSAGGVVSTPMATGRGRRRRPASSTP